MENNGGWQFNPNDNGPVVMGDQPTQPAPQATAQPVVPQPAAPQPVAMPAEDAGGINWTASEFIAHDKSSGWYALLAVGAVVGAVVVWFITKDFVSSAFIVIAAIMFGTFAGRQPRELAYRVDEHGLTIGQKYYPYGLFRSFAVMTEGAVTSIVFTPLKRIAPLTTIYYHPDHEESIIALLADRLPMEERKQDPIDRLMWRIRF